VAELVAVWEPSRSTSPWLSKARAFLLGNLHSSVSAFLPCECLLDEILASSEEDRECVDFLLDAPSMSVLLPRTVLMLVAAFLNMFFILVDKGMIVCDWVLGV